MAQLQLPKLKLAHLQNYFIPLKLLRALISPLRIMADTTGCQSLLSWKYGHYLSLLDVKNKNIVGICSLCSAMNTLSTPMLSNSNLMEHLTKQYASTKPVAKDPMALLTQKVPLHPNCQSLILSGRALLHSL